MAAVPHIDRVTTFHFEDQDRTIIKKVATNDADLFEVFGLPTRLVIDLEKTREVFLELSRHFHPDYFATADEVAREESLRRSSLVNNGWKILRDDQKRAEYVIERHGAGITSNKNAVPPELLEEMFDIQEAGEDLREARVSADAEKLSKAEARIKPLRDQVKASREKLKTELLVQFGAHDTLLDNGKTEDSEEVVAVLKRIRLILDQSNYLRTVLRNLK